MKRIGHIWEDVIDIDNAIAAVYTGTKNKRGNREVRRLLYDRDIIEDHPELQHRIDPEKARRYAERLVMILDSGEWQHGKPRYRRRYCRNRTHGKGKWRDLYITRLDDHIIAHMVMNASMEAFMRGMHPHCCGSVPGRGINHVVITTKRWFRKDKQCRYFVKLDIRHFFDNIRGDLIKETLRRKIKDQKVLQVFDKIIDSAGVACPVGYYTSPWFANLLLQDLDWYIEQQLYKERRGKRIKYVRHYLRYVDDLLLVGTCKKDLEKAIHAIQKYLKDHYGLELKTSWEIKKIGKHEIVNGKRRMKPDTYWCDIGGYKFCKDATIMRDGIYLETKRLAKRMHKKGYYSLKDCESINSRIGWASHCDSKRFIRYDIEPYINIERTRKVVRACGQKLRTARVQDRSRSNTPDRG